jgi:hypothetical protein
LYKKQVFVEHVDEIPPLSEGKNKAEEKEKIIKTKKQLFPELLFCFNRVAVFIILPIVLFKFTKSRKFVTRLEHWCN